MAATLFGPPRELFGGRARAAGAFNLALVAEGYTKAELGANLFWQHADRVVQELKRTAPFSSFTATLNIFGVAVVSEQSAQKIQTRCPAQAASERKTAFKVQFCVNNSPRTMDGDATLVKQIVRVDANLPFVNHFLVIVNSALSGGTGPPEVCWITASGSDWPKHAVHELGHSAFGLADEYEYREPGDVATRYSGSEFAGPNVTKEIAFPTFKWRSLVNQPAPWPSTLASPPPHCVYDHPPAPGVPAEAIGAFEGGGQFACDVYRPALHCKMRNRLWPFCAVCARHIVPTLFPALVNASHPTSFQLPPVTSHAAGWTHVLSLPDPAAPTVRPFVLLYDAASGEYQLRTTFGAIMQGSAQPVPKTTIDADITAFIPVVFGGNLELVAYRSQPSARFHFSVVFGGPGLAVLQKQREDHLPLPLPTHAGLATRGADQLALTYNRLTGTAILEQLGPSGQTPTFLAAEQWEIGWTLVTPLRGWAESLVLCYEWKNGSYAIRALPAAIGGQPAPVWPVAGNQAFMAGQLTHVLPVVRGSAVFVLGYSAINGYVGEFVVRDGGRGLDFLRRLTFDHGAPVLPPGQGLAALDTLHFVTPSSGAVSSSWLSVYSRAFGKGTVYGLP